jgi:hypothetical protein
MVIITLKSDPNISQNKYYAHTKSYEYAIEMFVKDH